MDKNTLTLRQAQQLIAKRGFQLSHEALSDYYEAIRLRRATLLNCETVAPH